MIAPIPWQKHLEPDEILLWQGRATPAMRLILPSAAEWIIGALGAVALSGVIIARNAWGPDSLSDTAVLVWLVVVLVALFVTGIPFRQMHQRAQTLRRRQYAITDRRVLVAQGKPAQISRATRVPGSLPTVRAEPTPGLGTLIVPVRAGAAVELSHVKDADGVRRVIEALR
ncbi:hypothetical protein ACEYYA_08020 [Paracoccus sp. p3-h83]|uniref:hypothetical protein n=1 Tax=Paracoccus sp. p3-h83 TaxID=3342805 RepID=UPI0035B9E345